MNFEYRVCWEARAAEDERVRKGDWRPWVGPGASTDEVSSELSEDHGPLSRALAEAIEDADFRFWADVRVAGQEQRNA